MKAYDVVGYTRDGAFYCPDCIDNDLIDDEETGAVFANSEWDYYPTCDLCGERCEDVCLTSDGEAYEHPNDEDDEEDDND